MFWKMRSEQESFGESVFKLTLRERKKKAAGPSKKKKSIGQAGGSESTDMAKTTTVYQLKITLAEIKPPIWRRVQVKDCSLSKLHLVIQAAMGWTNTHLWGFDVGGVDYGDDPEGDMDQSQRPQSQARRPCGRGCQEVPLHLRLRRQLGTYRSGGEDVDHRAYAEISPMR